MQCRSAQRPVEGEHWGVLNPSAPRVKNKRNTPSHPPAHFHTKTKFAGICNHFRFKVSQNLHFFQVGDSHSAQQTEKKEASADPVLRMRDGLRFLQLLLTKYERLLYQTQVEGNNPFEQIQKIRTSLEKTRISLTNRETQEISGICYPAK